MTWFSRLNFIFLIGFFLSNSLSAQSPYSFSQKGDGIFGGISGSILVGSVLLNRTVKPLSFEQWEKLDRSQVLPFDRFATTQWSEKSKRARLASDRLLYSSLLFPLSMAISRRSQDELGAVGLLTIETAVLNMGLTNLVKGLVKRPRPFTFNHEQAPWAVMQKQNLKDARRSFYSGHASTTASMYVLGAKMFSDFYPDSKWRPVVWTSAFVVPALTGLMRVKGGKHYATDVITGFVLGSAIGFLVPQLHKK